jgi:hypothetical protein
MQGFACAYGGQFMERQLAAAGCSVAPLSGTCAANALARLRPHLLLHEECAGGHVASLEDVALDL